MSNEIIIDAGDNEIVLEAISFSVEAADPRQESLVTENIVGADVVLTDTLDNTPISDASVKLFLNGVFQTQGPGRAYEMVGATGVRWLASSGTAVDMATTDELEAAYLI